jgi:transcriptional regulator with GAF, ATPase, and Fis domain
VDLEPLPAVILAIAEQRSLPSVLRTIIEAVARQPDVALARLWLHESDVPCSLCPAASPAEPALHLLARAGRPLHPDTDWSRTDGTFHRISLAQTQLKIAHIATSGRSIRIADLTADDHWVRHPQWARAEGLVSFAGHPLCFRGQILGVLAVFRRAPADDLCFEWLRTMASAAAVAIANARAFEQNEALRRQLEQERDYLREEVASVGRFGEILGRSPALERVLHQVEMVASTDANVLILGESGSGKELIARAIHQRSARSHKPLIKVNCGSIPHELFESEFFGHVRGSFTGAVRDRLGRFQLADGGTLFLDEVGEIPLDLQAKLLRVLQEGEFERVGDEHTRRVNVRVVAATNRDLKQEVAAGRFRLDLYYRLGVFPIESPPLRDRREDIPELIAHFLRQASQRFQRHPPAVPARELERALAYHWPGNVRELQNVVERSLIVAGPGKLTFDLPTTSPPPSTPLPSPPPDAIIAESEWIAHSRANILNALRQAKARVSGPGGAAELLGLHPATLASRIRALGIRKSEYKE